MPATNPSRAALVDGYRSHLAGLADLADLADLASRDGRTGYDELLGLPGQHLAPGTEGLAARLDQLGRRGVQIRRQLVDQMVDQDGISARHRSAGEPEDPEGGSTGGSLRAQGGLHLDPLPWVLTAAEWRSVEAGLRQRATLLDLLLRDLYGPQSLVRTGVLPAAAVLSHPGFVPQSIDTIPSDGSALWMMSTDLVRATADSGAGAWQVVADHTQAPWGAGYAMALRRVVTRALDRLHRHTQLRRLRGFFDRMRTSLLESGSSGSKEIPRVVLLGAGGESPTAFDQAFLSSLLGFPLVRSEDLAMERGRLWLLTTDRREQVDTLVRLVDQQLVDPLELDARSAVGIPGLVEATRERTVAVVNPVGAGVLEHAAIAAHLPAIARALLGQELLLAGPPAWWCGDADGAARAVATLDGPLDPPGSVSPGSGGLYLVPTVGDPLRLTDLDREARHRLREQLATEPWAWTLVDRPVPSTAPVVGDDGLEARRATLRTFTVLGADGPVVMPGGLGLLQPEAPVSASAATDRVKDVWVLAEPVSVGRAGQPPADTVPAPTGVTSPASSPPTAPARPGPGVASPTPAVPDENVSEDGADRLRPATAVRIRGPIGLSTRVAEDLYWLGRYAERAEGTARLLMVADDLVADHRHRPGTVGHQAMEAVLDAVSRVVGTREGRLDAQTDEATFLRALVHDGQQQGTVAYCTARAARAALDVREQLSVDTWMVLNRLDQAVHGAPVGDAALQPLLSAVLESLLSFAGITAESLVRDAGWAFLDAGRRIERAQFTIHLVRWGLGPHHAPATDAAVIEAMLRASENLISYRRRVAADRSARLPRAIALDLLLTDPVNPRSVALQLDRLAEALEILDDRAALDDLQAIHDDLHALDLDRLASGDARTAPSAPTDDADQSEAPTLAAAVAALDTQLRHLSNTLERTHFAHRATLRALPVAQTGYLPEIPRGWDRTDGAG